jgi:hypothetical protein
MVKVCFLMFWVQLDFITKVQTILRYFKEIISRHSIRCDKKEEI